MSIFGGGHKSAAKTPTKALGIDFQGAQYGPVIPVGYGQNKVPGNCIWYGDFQAIAVQQKQSGGKGGGGSQGTTSYDYKASYQLGLCEGVASIVNVYNGTSTVSLASLSAVSASGTVGQAPWAHLSGSAAIGYSGTTLVSFQNRDLGSSASLPNDNFECAWTSTQFGSGVLDANPAYIINDICTNAQYGINFGVLGSTTQYSNYCVAAGIFLSPVYDTQATAQQALSDLLKYTNADAWFSEGVLKIGCYGDQSITGNGATYTPNINAVANLTAADFITNGASSPITISRKSPSDAMNIERLEYVDRANSYHTSAVTASIDNDVVKSGARADQSDTYHAITNATVARLVVQNLLQRVYYIRNQYEFSLSWRYCYLEPFDIVTLTDANTGLNSAPVRITQVEEDEHGLLKITAEEFPQGVGHGSSYSTQANGGATVDPNSDPGPVAGPYLFRGPGFLVGNDKPEIWCAVTGNGNPLWAGCDVYLSHDGNSYTYVNTYARQARYGHITNTMAVQSDPDTVSAPNVVLNGNGTQLLGGSQADADQFVTLAMIDGEIVSYETATLASGPSYNLSYLRRGGYGTAIASHAANAPFVRLDDGILRIPVDPSQIGSTVYLKFLSRNCFGRTPRTLSGETAYQYVIGSSVELPDVPNVPDTFAVTAVADGVQITWTNDNPAAVDCTSIEYATASSGPFTVLAQVGPTTTAFHHSFTSGSTYYYRARSRGPVVAAGWSAYTTVLNQAGKTVANGATNGATIGPGGNVNGAVDGNGLALVDATQSGHLGAWNLDNRVLDGTTYYRMPAANMDGNRRGLIDFTQSGHLSKILDNIGDGSYYTRRAALTGFGTSVELDNAQFTLGGGNNFTGWRLVTNTAGGLMYDTGGTSSLGTRYMGLRSDTTGSTKSQHTRQLACTPGDVITFQALLYAPSGIAIYGIVAFYDKNDNQLTYAIAGNTSSSWVLAQANVTVPPNAVYMLPSVQLSAASSGYAYGGCGLFRIHTNDVRMGGSGGKLGDQRNLPSSASTGYGMIRSGTALTAYSTGAVNINDHYVQIGAAQIHYNAKTNAVTGLSVGSTYNILTHDNYVGGSPTFTYTTSAQTANSYDDAYVAGQVTIPSSGSGGGGGGGICVCADMWLRPGLRADRARWWHRLDAWDGLKRLRRRVRGNPKVEPAPCVRLITDRGAMLDCSVSTPFTLRDGRVALAPEMYGKQVLTDLGWENVIEVDGALGIRPVVRIHLGGISYAAGVNPHHRIFSHNYAKP